METVPSLCTDSLEPAGWATVTVRARIPAREDAVQPGVASKQDSTRDPGAGGCPVGPAGTVRVLVSSPTQGQTLHPCAPADCPDRDLGCRGCVAACKGSLAARKPAKVELAPLTLPPNSRVK